MTTYYRATNFGTGFIIASDHADYGILNVRDDVWSCEQDGDKWAARVGGTVLTDQEVTDTLSEVDLDTLTAQTKAAQDAQDLSDLRDTCATAIADAKSNNMAMPTAADMVAKSAAVKIAHA